MRIVSDMEHRLRSTAVDPPHRREHYDAVLGELRARHRIRNRKPYIFVAALLACLVLFRSPPLESFSYRFEYTEYQDDGSVIFKPYEDSNTRLGFTTSNDGELQIVTPAEAAQMQDDWATAQELYMAGQLDLRFVVSVTLHGVNYYSLIYQEDVDGRRIRYTERVQDVPGDDTDRWALIQSPEHLAALDALNAGELDTLPPATVVQDGHTIRLERWSYLHPTFGEVVIGRSTEIN